MYDHTSTPLGVQDFTRLYNGKSEVLKIVGQTVNGTT